MNIKNLVLVLFFIILIIFSCDSNNSVEPEAEEITPIYVTVAGHIESGSYYAEPNIYAEYREKLLDFIAILQDYDIPFNLQIAYPFLKGAKDCETSDMMEETENTNLVDYLAKYCNVEIDAHKGGGWEGEGDDNYADVRYIGGLVTDEITETVGGVIWNSQDQYERFGNGETGELYPFFIWYPEILTLGVHFDHHNSDFSNDDLTSGIWKPKRFDDEFLIHDEDASMVYVGPGMSCTDWFDNQYGDYPPMETSANYIELLAEYLTNDKIPADKMYTVTMSVPQSIIFFEDEHYKLTDQFDAIAQLVEQGKVIYTTYTEVVDIWQNQYNSEPNIFTFDNIDPEDYQK
ncbi:MAG: hypothetical protein KGY75_03215 [Candidatus Cloacimonetes bacterium]|nr:hypothetical protein [Candidatus Cloacimonadota bacterium]